MNRRSLLTGFLKCAAGVALLPQVEPFLAVIPSLHKKVKELSAFDQFEKALKETLAPAIGDLMKGSDPKYDVLKINLFQENHYWKIKKPTKELQTLNREFLKHLDT